MQSENGQITSHERFKSEMTQWFKLIESPERKNL
jgi:hypothetical protein